MLKQFVVVVGDVHAAIPLAVEGLTRLELELGAPISQTFSVGDLGLFFTPADWVFLTGPKKYRFPEQSEKIAEAWAMWRWPLAAIAGNHEPFHRLRVFDAEYFGDKLSYTNAGSLDHTIEGLRVYGLSGIHDAEHLEFAAAGEYRRGGIQSWDELLTVVHKNGASVKRLTYYKRSELKHLRSLPAAPHLLLVHDWPEPPDGVVDLVERPERELVADLRPNWVCCGHHHTPARFKSGESDCIALNIIGADRSHRILPGWAAVFTWDGERLNYARSWPDG